MCRFCNEEYAEAIINKNISVLNANVRFELYIGGESLRLCTNDEHLKPLVEKKINFCPMCGRNLTTNGKQ